MSCKFAIEGDYKESVEGQPIIKKEYTWQLIHSSDDIEGEKREIKAIKRAFLRWALVIPVRFRFVNDWEDADISITVSNNDNYFKERPNALAYAFVGTTSQPLDLVFNESYIWTLNREQGVNRYDMEVVAVHEIGHVLGLHHSPEGTSVMYPSYHGGIDLTLKDVDNIQKIHGEIPSWQRRIKMLVGYFKREL